jgi:hypothetical protein
MKSFLHEEFNTATDNIIKVIFNVELLVYNCFMEYYRRMQSLKALLNSLDEEDYKNAIIDSRFKYSIRLVYNPNWIEFGELFTRVLRVEEKILLVKKRIVWEDFSYFIRDKRKLEVILNSGLNYLQCPTRNGIGFVTYYIPDLIRIKGLIGDSKN